MLPRYDAGVSPAHPVSAPHISKPIVTGSLARPLAISTDLTLYNLLVRQRLPGPPRGDQELQLLATAKSHTHTHTLRRDTVPEASTPSTSSTPRTLTTVTVLDPLKKLFHHHGHGHKHEHEHIDDMAATAAQPPSQPLPRDPDAMDIDSEGPTTQSVGSTPTSESVTTPTTPTPEAVTANQSPVSGTPLPDQPQQVPDGAKAPQWKTDNGPAPVPTPAAQKPPAAAEPKEAPKPTPAPAADKPAEKPADAAKPPPVDKGPVPELKVSGRLAGSQACL